ncbi:MAG: ABC-F family ATP-binding cassette domain-containing protein, partial [Bacillota bacterium]
MTLLTLSQLAKSYGAETILEDVSLQLQPGEKAGLIGPNGSGKTTLLKIIAAEIEADTGTLHLTRGARVGYLSQEPPLIPSGTLRSYLEYPLRHIYALREKIAALAEEIAASAETNKSPRDLEERLERYANLTASFEEEGGYQVDSRLTGVARGLGFSESDFSRDISEFSGGEKTRARLAGLLLQDLDLLLLDEPTNFLDLSALEWLEKYLRDLTCALIVVSHDRFFLDRVVSRIFALQGSTIKGYSGNYSEYQKQLELQDLSTEREYRRLQLQKEREERLVREAKSDQRSKRQARSRQKRLDKLEPVERPQREQSFKLGLGYTGRSGRQVIIFDGIFKKFDQKSIFSDLSFEINWGDRIALIGPNGAGKTTLLKLVSGELKPSAGKIRLGPSVRVLYFDQEQEQLLPGKTLLETITAASDFDIRQARNHLGRYLFSGDDVFKQVGDLSGGEKSRLALARLALNSGNCLLMDEPTSHLDLPAMEKLENVLKAYPGTLVIVSHDRYFLKGLANRVFELDSGTLNIYDRSFEEYLGLKESSGAKTGKVDRDKEEEKRKRQEEHRRRQSEQRTERRLRDEQAALEKKIGEAEAEIERLEKLLSDPGQYGDYNHLAELGFALETAKKSLT